MFQYIENVNTYLSQMKIKQTFVSMKSGIDTKKLSRILSGRQEINGSDMEKIAKALGKNVEFFLKDPFYVPESIQMLKKQAVFYAGEPRREQEEFVGQLIELIENVDEVLSAQGCFMMAFEE